MIHAPLLLLLAAAQPAQPPVDPIDAAFTGLTAVVEQDGQPDTPLERLATQGCETVAMGAGGRRWTIDWRRIEHIALEDTFVFVSSPQQRLAIVADTSIPDQAQKLLALTDAMGAAFLRCNPNARRPVR